jgi:hypothetical protein
VKILCALVLLCLSACANTPAVEPSSPCNALTNCQEEAKLAGEGLPAKYTVQNMLQSFTLINGKPAEPADWPASVYVRSGDAACSATIIGDRVLFIASHCVTEGSVVEFSAHANNYTARCNMHPEYKKNSTADWSLCLIDRPVTGIPFEVLGVAEKLSVGTSVLMSGYGCIHRGGGGGNDGIFRVGAATVQGMPSGKTYDVVAKGGAALCFGDSGGAAYMVHPDGSRAIFGVNSRGDIDTMSYLPGVFAKTFIDWAKTWAKNSNNVKICGLHSDATSCRTGGGKPDGKVEISTKVGCVKGVIQPEYLGNKSAIVEKITKALQP